MIYLLNVKEEVEMEIQIISDSYNRIAEFIPPANTEEVSVHTIKKISMLE